VVDVAGPIDVVIPATRLGSLLVIAHEVPEARELAAPVEGPALIRETDVKHAARPADTLELEQPGDRVLQMLEQMVGDHEVDGRVIEGRQLVCARDHVDRSKVSVSKLGVLPPLLVNGQSRST
jgi:hypothetical protein